jgi:hypothetical protein
MNSHGTATTTTARPTLAIIMYTTKPTTVPASEISPAASRATAVMAGIAIPIIPMIAAKTMTVPSGVSASQVAKGSRRWHPLGAR